ncbi:MAG: hypothetical protein FWD60_13740 [Candidatus Azobacteroides sp.]|nr:hypothetical protein [Candidatus Azobacteroides sp.]
MSDNIELKTTGNQAIIGRIPSWLVKWGNLIILLVFILLLYISFHFTIPITVQGQVQITEDSIFIIIPQAKLNKIDKGQEVGLRMDDYPYMEYGTLHGKTSIDQVIRKENTAYIPIVLSDERNSVNHKDLLPGMQGTGDIVIEKLPLFYRIIKSK